MSVAQCTFMFVFSKPKGKTQTIKSRTSFFEQKCPTPFTVYTVRHPVVVPVKQSSMAKPVVVIPGAGSKYSGNECANLTNDRHQQHPTPAPPPLLTLTDPDP